MRMPTTGSRPGRRGGLDQAGNVLIITLMIVLFVSAITAALLTYASTSNRAAVAYRDIRDARYSGDGAVEAAVNWVAADPDLARDPDLSATTPACAYIVPTDIGDVTVTCGADRGGGSGEEAEGGLLPPEALLLTGRRVNWNESGVRNEQTGPYNAPLCRGWWDSVTNFFSNGTDPNAGDGYKEYSALFKPRVGLGVLNTTCNNEHARTFQQFTVDGPVVAAGRIRGTGTQGGFQALGAGNTITARHNCTGGGMTSCNVSVGTRSAGPNVESALVGTPRDSDPGRTYPIPGVNTSGNDPTPTDIRSSWLPVGFGSNGTLAAGYDTTNYPVRTGAYTLAADGTPTTIAGCPVSPAQTIVFLPGWYRDANVLNQYTAASSGCADRTFWLAPDPGPDGRLLTDDDITGSFYFDFRSTSATTPCGRTPSNDDMAPAHPARWCIGRTATQNPRVVAGTPKDWGPIGSNASPTIRGVTIDNAQVVDSDLSQIWSNGNGAQRIGDNSVARYQPRTDPICFWNIFNPNTCTSSNRSIRVRSFTPRVASGPLDGQIYVSAMYGLSGAGASSMATPRVEVRAVSTQSGEVYCGTFNLPVRTWNGNPATPPAIATISSADATTLANNCGQVDRINGFEIRLLFEGNTWNVGTPNVWLDGVRISYNSYAGASFPEPVSASDPVAQSDCDTTEAGVQLIFGGESHAFVGDGSLELCAGDYPTDADDHQVIGVYGVPGIAPIEPTSVAAHGGSNLVDPPLNPGNITAIDSQEVTIRYGGCAAYCGRDHEEGWLDVDMQPYSPPAGYEVSKIEARVSYNPKNSGCSFLWDCPGRAPQLRPPRCAIDYPKNPDRGPLQVANWNSAVLYSAVGTNPNCVNPAELAGGVNIVWAAGADCTYTFVLGWVCKAGGGQWSDTLDGIELDITIRPTDNTQPWLVPQSGCITASPNYNGGEGEPDCAILRSATANVGDTFNWPWNNLEAQGNGRFSINGTIYAPSAALDVDDGDTAYTLAQRGAVLRHLRVSGYARRAGTNVPAIGHSADRTPAPRETTFVACTRSPANASAADPCGDLTGDLVLTRARVRFELNPSVTPTSEQAVVPRVEWWSADT